MCAIAESCPGPIPVNASFSSERNVERSTVPMYPPESAVGSVDFSLASTAKSSPFFSCSRICWAWSAVLTTMMRSGTWFEGAVCAGKKDVVQSKRQATRVSPTPVVFTKRTNHRPLESTKVYQHRAKLIILQFRQDALPRLLWVLLGAPVSHL